MPNQVTIQMNETEVRIRTPRGHLAGAGAGLGFLIIGIAMLTTLRPYTPYQIVLSCAAIALGAGLTRAARHGGLTVTSSKLVEKGDLRKRVIEVGRIQRLFVRRAPHILPWYCLWVRLNDKADIALPQVRVLSFRPSSGLEALQAAAETANTWLQQLGGQPSSPADGQP